APATPRDAKGLIKSAIRDNNPVLFLEHKLLYRRIKEELPETGEEIIPIGKARVARAGKDIILHEDTKTGGLAGEITAIINEDAFEDLDGPIVRIASLDTPVPFSPPLENFFLPKAEDVVREARKLH